MPQEEILCWDSITSELLRPKYSPFHWQYDMVKQGKQVAACRVSMIVDMGYDAERMRQPDECAYRLEFISKIKEQRCEHCP